MIVQKKNSILFCAKFETGKVLEVTTQKIFYSKGLKGPTEVIKTLNGKHPVGNRGYKYMACKIGEKITSKYPKIKEATDEIKKIFDNNPEMSREQMAQKLKPVLDRFDKEIDITI